MACVIGVAWSESDSIWIPCPIDDLTPGSTSLTSLATVTVLAFGPFVI